MRRSMAGGLVFSAALVVLAISSAGAQIDAAGEFDVNWYDLDFTIRQSGSTLDVCIVDSGSAIHFGSGTIDTATGAFSFQSDDEFLRFLGPYANGFACAFIATGTFAADGSTFTAQMVEETSCVPPPFSCVPQCEVWNAMAISGTRVAPPTLDCCGNGVVEGSESCDDGNLSAGTPGQDDCCNFCGPRAGACLNDANACTTDACNAAGICEHVPVGDGGSCNDNLFCNGSDTCVAGSCSIHAGDPCAGGDECSDTCSESGDICWGPDFTPCADDGDPTTTDFCLGVCQHQPLECGPCEVVGLSACEPAPAEAASCAQPSGPGDARLLLRNPAGADGDRLRWKLKLPAVPVADFGNPATSDDYALCVYGDEVPASPTLLLQADLQGGATCGGEPCWSESVAATTGTFRYSDRSAGSGGVTMLRMQTSASRAKVILKGKGTALGVDDAGWQAPLRVQLRNSAAKCWESRLDDVVRSSSTRLIVENSQ